MITKVYCDGGVIGHNPSTIGGTWAFCYVDENDKRIFTDAAIIFPTYPESKGKVTNNLTELLAMVRALELLPRTCCNVTLYSDSQITLGRVFENWNMRNIPRWLVDRANKCTKGLIELSYVHVDGHPTKQQLERGKSDKGNLVSVHNVFCDNECKRVAQEYLNNPYLSNL